MFIKIKKKSIRELIRACENTFYRHLILKFLKHILYGFGAYDFGPALIISKLSTKNSGPKWSNFRFIQNQILYMLMTKVNSFVYLKFASFTKIGNCGWRVSN